LYDRRHALAMMVLVTGMDANLLAIRHLFDANDDGMGSFQAFFVSVPRRR